MADPRVDDSAPSILAGSTHLLLLPAAAASELNEHLRTVLEGAADAPNHRSTRTDAATNMATTSSTTIEDHLSRRELWCQHLEPLLADFGYVLVAARKIGSSWTGADTDAVTHSPVEAWLELAGDVLAHCKATGLVECAQVLRQSMGGGSGGAADITAVAAADAAAIVVAATSHDAWSERIASGTALCFKQSSTRPPPLHGNVASTGSYSSAAFATQAAVEAASPGPLKRDGLLNPHNVCRMSMPGSFNQMPYAANVVSDGGNMGGSPFCTQTVLEGGDLSDGGGSGSLTFPRGCCHRTYTLLMRPLPYSTDIRQGPSGSDDTGGGGLMHRRYDSAAPAAGAPQLGATYSL